MKKIVLLLITLVGAFSVQASLTPSPSPNGEESSFSYLTFVTTDGTKASVPVSSLTINITGNTLTVGSQTFTLSNLSKMYFSTSDESMTTGIEKVTGAALDEATEIYNLQGHKVSKEQLQKGVYIVKTKDKTYKIAVK